MFGSISGLTAVLLYLRQSKYAAHFGYDRQSDFRYRFDPAASDEAIVDIKDGGFRWPSGPESDTAFLGARVTSAPGGRMVDPWVRIRCGGFEHRQYVERGAAGLRYLNLSPIAHRKPEAGTRVELSGQHLAIHGGKSSLIRMKTDLDPDARVLVIAPHPDDAEIAAFGLYSEHNSWIVTLTAGEVGTHDFGGILSDDAEGHRLRGRLRVWESITAPFAGEVPSDQALNLGYFDGTLQAMRTRPDQAARSASANTDDLDVFRRHNVSSAIPKTPPKATWRGLVEDLRMLIDRIQPTVIVAPHPLLDSHPDHAYGAMALAEAMAKCNLEEGTLLLYANHPPGHGSGANIHPVGRRDGTVSLPPMSTDEKLFERVYSHPMSSEAQRRKLLALDVFRDLREPVLNDKGLFGAAYESLREVYRKAVVYDSSFVRKSVRPNELFYVIPFARSQEFFEEFNRRL